jgi:hypothetical protein
MAQQPAKPAKPPQRDERRENQREAERDEREEEREAERRDQAKARAGKASVEAVETIADEQRERSAEIEAMGVENWKAAGDEREDADAGEGEGQKAKQRTVAGVSTAGDARTLEPGSSRR